ncbi:hypothetical protein EV126DRAFT_406931 [Verticillium dahliae]|nr:hypothetical protein EV126DRAFT_406931 [Verticillium dahliae]
MAVDLMVIPRSCSSALVSVARWSPALAVEMIPALDRRESVRVDLPWSTWAMTDMLRTLQGLSISCRISSVVKLTILAVVLGVNFLVGKFVDVLLLEAGSRDSAPRAEDA